MEWWSDDAFASIARDGAGLLEVSLRLQKGLKAIASVGHPGMRDAARKQARRALARSEKALLLPEEIATLRDFASFAVCPPVQEEPHSSTDAVDRET